MRIRNLTSSQLASLASFNETLNKLSTSLAQHEAEQGNSYSLEELIEEIRNQRVQVLREKYGIVIEQN